MALIVGDNIAAGYERQRVFSGAGFNVSAGERIGLVGPNGEGKTTLLRVLTGALRPLDGRLQVRRDLRVGHLPQEAPAPREVTLWEAMAEVFADLRRMERRLHELAERMGDDPEKIEEYGHMQHAFEDRGGYAWEAKVRGVLTGLGFGPDRYDRPLAELSGGQRTRALLGRLLLEAPEVLLLDEPTNHLDIDAVEWLERFLKDFPGSLVTVSHDRYFLDNVTNRTWEMSGGSLTTYPAPYSRYVELRAERVKAMRRQYARRQEHIAVEEEFIRRNLAGQRTKEAQGRRTRLERLKQDEAIEAPPAERRRMALRFDDIPRSGDLVLRAKRLHAGYEPGRALVTLPDELELRSGERVAIVGANGSGKTTLLRTLLGRLAPLGGEVRRGANVFTGYLPQTHETLDLSATAVESVRAATPAGNEQIARDALGALQLTAAHADKRIDQLSGGQRSRVILARLVVQGANFLVLDEPTNHLDIPSQEVLQEVLGDFPGALLFVSHDRYLIEGLASTLWVIHDGGLKVLRGGWEAFLAWRRERAESGGPAAGAAEADKQQRLAERERRRQQKRARERLLARQAELEEQIDAAERELEQISADIDAAGEAGDVDRVEQLGRDYTALNERLRDMMHEWGEVAERLE